LATRLRREHYRHDKTAREGHRPYVLDTLGARPLPYAAADDLKQSEAGSLQSPNKW